MPSPNWDDDFDFDDDQPKKKNVPDKKKPPKDNDFFDDDENSYKLPSIASKNTISKQLPSNKRSSARPNPYVENMKLKSNVYDDQDVYEQIEDQPKAKPNNNIMKSKKKDEDFEVDYYEDIQDEPKKKNNKYEPKNNPPKLQQSLKKLVQKQAQDQYEEEVFDDAYGDDFEEPVEQVKSPPKKIPQTDPPNKKSITPISNKVQSKAELADKKKISINQPPKVPIKSQKKQLVAERNMTVDKNQKAPIQRSNSRQGLKSAQSRRANQSRAVSNKLSTNTTFVPNKYSTQIDKSFPEVNLNQMNQDKINKLNEKLRGMIKKFNQQLNELINKNMLYLKAKKTEKSINVDMKVKILEEQSKNNETVIQLMQKEYDKLAGRDGELREEEYQLMTQRKIQQASQLIKQTQKVIVRLKAQIKSQGNKLTNKNEDKKLAAQLHHIKTTLIQTKKDQERQNERITKLDEQMEDLGSKLTDVEYRLSQLFDQAKQKGIQLESRQQITKKYENIKKKVQASKNHRSKLQSLLKTKSDIISHEKQQMKINIKNCEMEIKNLYDSISHVHNQSIKVVEKAKNNPKTSNNLLNDLDAILKSLELVQPDNYSVRSDENKSQHSNRPLKNSAMNNMQKSQPQKRSESANNQKHGITIASEDLNKPNLLKKKGNKLVEIGEQKKNEANERIWREGEKEKEKQKQRQRQRQRQRQKQKERERQRQRQRQRQKEKERERKQKEEARIKQQEEEKDKKKPFTIKKNRINSENRVDNNDQNKNEIKNEAKNQPLKLELELEKKPEEEKKEQISLAGPRMMKFKRRGNDQNKQVSKQMTKQIIKEEEKPKLSLDNKIQEPLKIEEQKPSFVPKRFTLRNRQQKKQDSYIPSIQNKEKQEPKKEIKLELKQEIKQQTTQKKNDQYKPKFNFNEVEDNFKKPINDPYQKKQQPNPPVNEKKEEEDKPKFNLRLRDRRKNNQEPNGGSYMPSFSSQNKIPQEKTNANLQSKQQLVSNNRQQNGLQHNSSNPYLAKDNSINIGNKQNIGAKQQPKIALNKQMSNPYLLKQQVNKNKSQEENPKNNPSNPYAQINLTDGGKKKEGPIKKPKLQQQGQKKKINIYEQAEEAEGLNEFVNQPKFNKQADKGYNPTATKDLNLNDLLGIKNNKKNNDDLADLIGGANTNKKPKKHNDFFGDMDI